MSDERQPCQSCAGMLSDFSLFDALKSEDGVNISQTAQEFYAAVDNGCLICSGIHEMACRYADISETATAAFRCRPESSADASRALIKNIQFETTGPDSFNFKSCQMTIWSAEYRYISTLHLVVEAQEGKYMLVVAKCVGLTLLILLMPLHRRPSSRIHQHSAIESTSCFRCELWPCTTVGPRLLAES